RLGDQEGRAEFSDLLISRSPCEKSVLLLRGLLGLRGGRALGGGALGGGADATRLDTALQLALANLAPHLRRAAIVSETHVRVLLLWSYALSATSSLPSSAFSASSISSRRTSSLSRRVPPASRALNSMPMPSSPSVWRV